MELRKKALDFVNRAVLPIILGCVIVNMICRCYYYEMRGAYTALYAGCAAVLFMLFDVLKKRRFIGFLAYVAMMAGVVFVSTQMMREAYRETHIIFTDWFYLNRAAAGFSMGYFLYMYIFGGFFLTSIIYYFTQIRFRSLGLMLCLLFPFVIYAKRADIMSNFDVTLVITVFLAIVVHNRQLYDQKKDTVRAERDVPYYVSIALFVSFAGALAMMIPKPTVKSVLERDSHAFDITPMNQNSNNYSNYTKVSSNRYGASYTNEILFRASTTYRDEEAMFLKRQFFDVFKDEQWRVELDYTNYNGMSDDYEYLSFIRIDRKQYTDIIKKLAETGEYEKYGLTAEKAKFPEQISYTFNIYTEEDSSFSPVYIPVPLGLESTSMDSRYYYLAGDGELSVLNRERDFDYSVSYYPETKELIQAVRKLGLTSEQYYAILSEAADKGDSDASLLLEQYKRAFEYFTGNVEYTDRMRDLAFEIVKDCKSDYEKAKALSDYFQNNGYTYDMDYVPEDGSIDYFIFEGKTGVCTSYATAMTIMARIVGLPARYVEGFAAYETDEEDGTFVIRDAHAHAYVEVYIPGGGWMAFDPTIEGYAIDRSGNGGFDLGFITDYFSRLFVFLAVLLIVFFIIMFDRVVEFCFRARQHFVKGDKRIIRLYARTVRLLEQSSDDDYSSYTPHMIAETAKLYNRTDVEPIVTAFERTCFGAIPLEDAEYQSVYAYYKGVYKFLRKRPKEESVPLAQSASLNE